MKANKLIIPALSILLSLLLLFTGCDNQEETDNNAGYETGFIFVYADTTVYLGDYANDVLEKLGPELNFYEYDNDVFNGTMKIYCYNGFDISTYAKAEQNEYKICSIALNDDSILTCEGISIGQTVSDMIEVYGEAHEAFPGSYYRYIKAGTALSFDVDDNIIIAITYSLINV